LSLHVRLRGLGKSRLIRKDSPAQALFHGGIKGC
jgi:hypothetical protein